MKRIGIFGTSGHAREIGDLAIALGYEPVYLAQSSADLQTWSFPDDVALESEVAGRLQIPLAIGIGDNAARQRVFERYAQDCQFPNLIHPSSILGPRQSERLIDCQGVLVCAGATLTNNIQLGNFTVFNRGAQVGHDCFVEDYVHLAPGSIVSGNVLLGCRCWIGAGAIIIQGAPERRIVIGADALIGAGAVVLTDCDPGGTYVGVPARRLR